MIVLFERIFYNNSEKFNIPARAAGDCMGIFSSLEDRLERYFDTLFGDRYGGRIRPVEVARKLFRAMRELKQVSVKSVFAPNAYTVFLNPEDYQQMAPFLPLLTKELAQYLQEKAREANYTLLPPVRVSFQSDAGQETGRLRVTGAFHQVADGEAAAGNEAENYEATLSYPSEKRISGHLPASVKRIVLVVAAGSRKGQEMPLDRLPAIIGRRAGCDLVIPDPGVSRRHAWLEYKQGGFLLTDLGSTNGTFVNGLRITSRKIQSGDLIKMGSTVFCFQVK